MEKNYRRWYEKNDYLKAFIDLLESVDVESQSEIAIDIIMRVSENSENDYSRILHEIAEYDSRDYKRWYDETPSLHLAVETFRDIDEEQMLKIVHEFTDKVVKRKYKESFEEND